MTWTWETGETVIVGLLLMAGAGVLGGLAVLLLLLPFGDARFRLVWVWRPWVRRRIDQRRSAAWRRLSLGEEADPRP